MITIQFQNWKIPTGKTELLTLAYRNIYQIIYKTVHKRCILKGITQAIAVIKASKLQLWI